MTDLTTPEGILDEARAADRQCAPSQYAPLLRRCADMRRSGAADPTLNAEVADYASTLTAHGLMSLADNLRRACPQAA